ncbi:hypothetical protein ACH5RR_031856 [Cinchona calisaya]|uniref:Protein FAR1-RELATED SEQUENCE n=1 Tax=Cinchona calisaya TaxID=153742 RepID=A0ABD2YGE8_9GENT
MNPDSSMGSKALPRRQLQFEEANENVETYNIVNEDAKMRADYVNFGDVVCFDTTYRKNNEANHLSGVFGEFKSFANDFSKCIYDFEEEEDFVEEWNKILDKYDLQDNKMVEANVWDKGQMGISLWPPNVLCRHDDYLKK